MSSRLALVLAALLSTTGLLAAELNLIHNPGFEAIDPTTHVPQEWAPVYWSNPHGKIEAADEAHSGTHSLKITGLPREQITDAGKQNNNLAGQELGERMIGPGRLTLRVWVKTAGDGSAYCSVITADKDGHQLQYLISRRVTQQPEWTELVFAFTCELETQAMTVYLRNGGADSVWFDDLSLVAAGDVLENDYARVVVDPLLGGRVCSYLLKRDGREATVWQGVRPGGMGADIAPADAYPGLLRDAPSALEVLEPRARVLVRHQDVGGSLAGLRIEKEYRLLPGSASVEVTLRVRNTAAEARRLSLRAQQCLPPTRGVFSWPARDHVRVVQLGPNPLTGSIALNDLREGWLAYSDPAAASGMVMLFDHAQAEKALVCLSPELYTFEWYYRPVDLPPGGSWQTAYTIAPVAGGAPIVAASPALALSLSPLQLPAPTGHTLNLFPLQGERQVAVQIDARVGGKATSLQRTVELAPTQATALALPWPGPQVQRLRIVTGSGPTAQTVTLAAALINDKPLHDLAPAPERTPFPALAGFFPYGEYFRGYVGPEAGTLQQATARQLRAYRRAYLNTYTVGEGLCLAPLKAGETPWLCELARQVHMRLIPKGDMLRRFENKADGTSAELPAPPGTREAMLERIAATGFGLDLRRSFAQQYGDTVLAYDLSDEPGSDHVPAYVQLQALYREADPAHPVVVILNLERTEYLPYMPVYYGDEYPIHKSYRKPWAVADIVRFCAQKTPAPVWVMLQAFGGRADYEWQLPTAAETRLTAWLVVANGGKGITWHGSHSPPCWRYHQHYFATLCDSWGAATPGWDALREAGRQLTAVGPALLQTDYTAAHPFTVETEQLDLGKGRYQGPAVTLGVLQQRDGGGHFIVAVNQDLEHEQRATLQVDAAQIAAGAQLCDLRELTAPGAVPAAGLPFALAPGDGRVFYCGPPAAAQAALAAVHRGHYDNERVIYEMDAGLAAANGVDMAATAAPARQAAAAYDRGDYPAAHRQLTAVQAKLAAAVAAARSLSEVLSQLQEALGLLSQVATVYRENFDVLVPPAVLRQTPRNQRFVNKQDPKLQQYVDDTAQAFCDRMLLEDRVYAGQAQAVAGPVAQLLQQARRLHAEAIPYVRSQAAARQG